MDRKKELKQQYKERQPKLAFIKLKIVKMKRFLSEGLEISKG
jgi:hypothetical protein